MTWTSYYWFWIYDSANSVNDYIGKEHTKDFSYKASIAGDGYAAGGCVTSEVRVTITDADKITLLKNAVANKSKYLYIRLNAAETKPAGSTWWQKADENTTIATLYVTEMKENIINNMPVLNVVMQDIFSKLGTKLQDGSSATKTAQELITEAITYVVADSARTNITTINEDLSSWTLSLGREDISRKEIIYNLCEIYGCYCRALWNNTLEVRKLTTASSGSYYKRVQKSDVFNYERATDTLVFDGLELHAYDDSSKINRKLNGTTSTHKNIVFVVDKNPYIKAANLSTIASTMRYKLPGITGHRKARIPFTVGIRPGLTVAVSEGYTTLDNVLITTMRWDGGGTCEIEEDEPRSIYYESELEA